MNITLIDEQQVFQLDPNPEISVLDFAEDVRVVVVDNFYANPDLVRQLALTIPPTQHKNTVNRLTGSRINASYDLVHLGPAYEYLITKYWPERSRHIPESSIAQGFTRATFMVNVVHAQWIEPRVPHVDCQMTEFWASGIYLNTEDESSGGTGFWSHRGDVHTPVSMQDSPQNQLLTHSHGDWELLGVVPMVYNRMIVYPQNVLHMPDLHPNSWQEHYRINQQFFIGPG